MIQGTVQVTGPIAPTSTTDTYPVTDAIYGLDGLRNVADQTELLAIPNDRRRWGMIVGDQASGKYYKLLEGPWTGLITDWEEINMGQANVSFKNIAVNGQSNIVAGSATDTLEFEAGPNVTLTTDPLTKKLKIQANVAASASLMYNGLTPSTRSIENIPAGTNLSTYYLQDLLENIYAPFIAPTIPTLSITGLTSTVEVGTVLTSSVSFVFTMTNQANFSPNTLDIVDVTNSVNLVTDTSVSSPKSASIGTVSKPVPATHSWRVKATPLTGVEVLSPLYTVSWMWKKYYGVSTDQTLTEANIEALTSNALSTSISGVYTFSAGGYKYISVPTTFTDPISFKDQSTNLDVVMCTFADNAAYSNIDSHGFYYESVSVTNANGNTINYRVYRTKNILGGPIVIIVV